MKKKESTKEKRSGKARVTKENIGVTTSNMFYACLRTKLSHSLCGVGVGVFDVFGVFVVSKQALRSICV